MGTIIAVKYPTKLFLKFFDHTYVMCGTGKVRWPCWGGSTGGTAFRRASASTMRAALIAGADGKAGIACYLVNGVCHQAANRIMSAGDATVRGARGDGVSTALYGAYGRPFGIAGTCASPFDEHLGVTGDLPDCLPGPGTGAQLDDIRFDPGVADAEVAHVDGPRGPGGPDGGPDDGTFVLREREFMAEMRWRYAERGGAALHDIESVKAFQLDLFDALVDFRLGDGAREVKGALMNVRARIEDARIPLDYGITRGALGPEEFVTQYNALTERFQDDVLNAVGGARYRQLFDLEPGDTVVFGEVEVAREAYSSGRSGQGEA